YHRASRPLHLATHTIMQQRSYSRLGWEVCATVVLLAVATDAFSIRDFVRVGGKRAVDEPVKCPTWHPFECPSGQCVPIKYLCDGSPDCQDGYDEDKNMCTAATRPPVEETAAFLNAVITAHSPDFFVKVFGPKARNRFEEMGGVDRVAVAISQSPTNDVFAKEVGMDGDEMMRMTEVMEGVMNGSGDLGFNVRNTVRTKGLTADEANSFRFLVQKLQETGFF
ncbi:hypothetical protein PFISCL1PPCAC_1448, partial [Pristionchus fissidentatus]